MPMDGVPSTRWKLAGLWTGFVFIWLVGTWFVIAIVGLGTCGGDGGTPYAERGSPRDDYCNRLGDYWEWGEPGNLHAVPFLIPLLVPVVIGIVGVWRRSARFLAGAAIALACFSVAYLMVPYALPG